MRSNWTTQWGSQQRRYTVMMVRMSLVTYIDNDDDHDDDNDQVMITFLWSRC